MRIITLGIPADVDGHQKDASMNLQLAVDVAWKNVKRKYLSLLGRYNKDLSKDWMAQRNFSHECEITLRLKPCAITLNRTIYLPPMVGINADGCSIRFRNGMFPDEHDVSGDNWHLINMPTYECHNHYAGFVRYGQIYLEVGGKRYVVYHVAGDIISGRYSIAGKGTLIHHYGMTNNLKIKDTHMLGWSYSAGKHSSHGITFSPTFAELNTRFGNTTNDRHSGSTDMMITGNFFEHFKRGVYGSLGFNPAITNNNFGETLHPVWCMSAENLVFTGNWGSTLDNNHGTLGTVIIAASDGGLIANNSFRRYTTPWILRGNGTIGRSNHIHNGGYIVSKNWTPPRQDIVYGDIPLGMGVGGGSNIHDLGWKEI